ncbi:MAG: hypothetical protein H6807_16775 [Planctomycetes bacterium]|nr:hypothetical protein [Planctomycetota bacterium]
MSEKEANTIEETKTEAPAPVAEPSVAPEAPASGGALAGVRLRLVAVGRLVTSRGRGHYGRLIAGLLFLVICLGTAYQLRHGLVFDVVEKPTSGPAISEFPSELTAGELVRMGQGALEGQDVDTAARFLEEARIRAERGQPDDINLFVDVFEGLARVAEIQGRPRVAELYRDYVRRKQAELGRSLPLFSAAERDFHAGELAAARRNYARFLLTQAALGEAGSRYVQRARRRLAEIWEMEFERKSGGLANVVDLAEPKEFFDERR